MAPEPINASWYDYPKYYDLAFLSETLPEVEFIEAAFRKYCNFEARRLLEPACGTGRAVVELAKRGYELVGLDLNEPSLGYLRQRLAEQDLKADIFHGDMSDFELSKPVDGAYCLINSFRHLLTEEAALAHLRSVARSLRPGGVYLLGFHLLPPDADEEDCEEWSENDGQTEVSVRYLVLETSRPRRIEKLQVTLVARSAGEEFRLVDEFECRMYMAGEFLELLEKVPEFELCDVYDFWYDLDEPLELSDENGDTVFVLRKVAEA